MLPSINGRDILDLQLEKSEKVYKQLEVALGMINPDASAEMLNLYELIADVCSEAEALHRGLDVYLALYYS